MQTGRAVLKASSKTAFAALAILVVFAAVFYKERLFADTSYIAFNIINYTHLAIQEHRYGSFITQMVPWLGIRLHLSLEAILVSYTLSFNIFYLAVAYVLVFRVKQYGLAVIMALFYFLFVTESFFWPVNEVNQAVAWMFLFLGTTLYMGNKGQHFFVLLIPYLVLSFFTISTHFVAIIPTVFLLVYFFIEKANWPFSKNMSILLSIVFLAVIAFKFSLVSASSYDDVHLHRVTHFSIQDIIDSFSTPTIQMFGQRCLTIYWPSIIVFIAGMASLVRSKKYALATWTFLSVLGYFIIIGLTYETQDKNMKLFHIESEWTCLGIIIATPFVFSFLQGLKPGIAVTALIITFLIRLGYIYAAAAPFTSRIQFQQQIMAQMRKKKITKLAIFMDNVYRPKLLLDWTCTFESVFFSSMNGDKPHITFCTISTEDEHAIKKLKNSDSFWDNFNTISAKGLNPEYYHLDTTTPYQLMTFEEILK